MFLVFVGGEEQDWSVAGTLSRPDELRGLKSVHVRHFHVQENGGKVLFEQMAQRFHAGVGNYQVLSETLERVTILSELRQGDFVSIRSVNRSYCRVATMRFRSRMVNCAMPKVLLPATVVPSTAANMQARAAFLYGGGADFNITNRVFFRAGYRGLVYNSPNFDVPALNVDRLTHRAEPFGGIGYRF